MINLTIIGKNSDLYQNLKPNLLLSFGIIKELSYKDLMEEDEIHNPLIFSFDRSSTDSNVEMLKSLINKSKGKVIYISTSAVHAYPLCAHYKYPRIKKEIENFLIENTQAFILRFGIYNREKNTSGFFGSVKITDDEKFIGSIKEIHSSRKRIHECYNHSFISPETKWQELTLKVLNKLLILKNLFFLTRPIDLILRFKNFKNYGYSFISNHTSTEMYDNVIVGKGMAALGVFHALKEHKSKPIFKIIDNSIKTPSITIQNNSNKTFIERTFLGGNSQLWHSVISAFKYDIDKGFREKELKRFYNISRLDLLEKGYSFIPFKPLRPLSYFPKKSFIDDKILLVQEDDNKILIYGKNNEYRATKLFLCTGSISTLKILNNSNLLNQEKIYFSDHSIGLIGQLKLSSKQKNQDIIFSKKGHFKKHYKVKLNDSINAYLSIRPAFYKLKSIKTAEFFKGFYASSSKKIIINLLKRLLNRGLILEALYNKFGFQPFKTNTYNIIGHLDNKYSFQFNTINNKVLFIKNSIELGDAHKQIEETFNKILEGDVNIRPEMITLLPGLHFLEASVDINTIESAFKGNLCINSTLKFKNINPEHPTFDLYLESMATAINVLETD